MPPDEVAFVGAGINHQSFILRFERDGEDLYPLLDAAIERDPELRRRVRVDIYRRLGYFPTESSEHGAEYVPWYMRHDAEVERLRIPPGEYVRRSRENLDEFDRVKAQVAAAAPVRVGRSLEYASLIIHSIETGEPRVVYGNVRNAGQIANLPLGACVEGPCLVDATGVAPVDVGLRAGAVRGAQPDVPEPGRADGAGGARGTPRPRPPRRAARPEHRRDPDGGPDRAARGRAARGVPGGCCRRCG